MKMEYCCFFPEGQKVSGIMFEKLKLGSEQTALGFFLKSFLVRVCLFISIEMEYCRE